MNFLVVLLVVSNVATGIFSVYLLRKLDARYSELINQSVPVLNDMQTLTALTVEVMRSTNPSVVGRAPADSERGLARGRAALERERALQEKLIKRQWLAADHAARIEVERTGAEFSRLAGEFLNQLAGGMTPVLVEAREQKLRPAFERYQTALTVATDVLEAHSLRTNDALSADTGSLSKIVLGVAGWPLIVMIALLVLTVCFVVVLMFVFRGKELGDMP